MSVSAQTGTSAWAPLRHPAFRVVWLTFLGIQLVQWSETVGAVEVIAAQSDSALLLALVQTATMAPGIVLSLPAGAAADLVDRRRVLFAIVAAMTATMTLLAVLVWLDAAPPVVVLLVTLAVGAAFAIAFPAVSALIPDVVPRRQLAAGVTLVSISINLARAVGPAAAGLLLALASAEILFAILAAGLAGMTAMLVATGGTGGAPPAARRKVGPAIVEGLRYVRRAPDLQAVLTRAGGFMVPGSALWAVLPAVTVQRLGLGAAAFGGILAALGVGAVAGAQLLPWLRSRLSLDALVRWASAYSALNLVLLATVDITPLLVASLVVAGAAWLTILSSLNTAAQLVAPAWVRGRAMSVNQLVFSASIAAGSALWGVVAELTGLRAALLIAAGMVAASLALAVRFRLAEYDRQPADDVAGEPALSRRSG
jgi:MFS family permease